MGKEFKIKKVDDLTLKLKRIASKAYKSCDYERCFAAISACANVLYCFNQVYIDENLEEMLIRIGNNIVELENFQVKNKKTILFYDGFGLDTRGLALIYLKALVNIGYEVIYVTSAEAKNNQPEIHKVVEGKKFQWIYIDMSSSYSYWVRQLNDVFIKYGPASAFFYTKPDDVAATTVFSLFKNRVIRYQIDLTDHAFWLGKYAFDYSIELRDVGCMIANKYRGIESSKMLMLPYYPTIDYDASFMGFDFETEGYRIVFSGGSLYKTHGGSENQYYKIVDELLKRHEDVLFIYAGYGDDSELKVLMNQYHNRVYHIAERKDLHQVMKQSVFFLNTYPMFGGLMMQYAVTAGKLPITLRHNNDADGILINQAELGIEFDSVEELLQEVDKLLDDKEYLEKKEELIKGSVITEKIFEEGLQMLLEENKTIYPISTEDIDTTQFREEYILRFDYDRIYYGTIFKRKLSAVLHDEFLEK